MVRSPRGRYIWRRANSSIPTKKKSLRSAHTASCKNYAFIDGNNLYLGAKSQDIELDYGKLRKYLRTKFDVEKMTGIRGRYKNLRLVRLW